MDGKRRDLLVDIELIWKCRLTCVSKNFKKKLKKNCIFYIVLIR